MVWQPQRVTNWFRPVKKLSLCGYSTFLHYIFHRDQLWKSIITMIHIKSLKSVSSRTKRLNQIVIELEPVHLCTFDQVYNLVSNSRLYFELWILNFLLKFQDSSEIDIRATKRLVSKAQSSVGLVFLILV